MRGWGSRRGTEKRGLMVAGCGGLAVEEFFRKPGSSALLAGATSPAHPTYRGHPGPAGCWPRRRRFRCGIVENNRCPLGKPASRALLPSPRGVRCGRAGEGGTQRPSAIERPLCAAAPHRKRLRRPGAPPLDLGGRGAMGLSKQRRAGRDGARALESSQACRARRTKRLCPTHRHRPPRSSGTLAPAGRSSAPAPGWPWTLGLSKQRRAGRDGVRVIESPQVHPSRRRERLCATHRHRPPRSSGTLVAGPIASD